MKNPSRAEYLPLPGKADSDYGSFRTKLLKVETGNSGDQRYVIMQYLNADTNELFSRTYATTGKPDEFTWSADEMGGDTNRCAVISNLDQLVPKIGAEAVQQLKEHLGLTVAETRHDVSEVVQG